VLNAPAQLTRNFRLCTSKGTFYHLDLVKCLLGHHCRTGGVATKGRWQLVSTCPVTLEMTESKSKRNTMMIVPLDQRQSDDSPMNTEVHVDDMQSAVFGVLRAKENFMTHEIDLVVDPPPEKSPDLSCR